MSALGIIKRMQPKCAAFDSYEDKGTVTTIAPDWPGSKITFATHLRRPAFFRFEWDHDFRDRRGRKRTTHHLILSDGMSAYWCDENLPPKREKCLILLIAGATGVSSSAAYNIPGMLLPEVGGFLPADLERLVFRRMTLQSLACYRIEGFHPCGLRYRLFIGQKDLLLRKLVAIDEDGTVSTDTRRDIRINKPIDEQVFKLAPTLVKNFP